VPYGAAGKMREGGKQGGEAEKRERGGGGKWGHRSGRLMDALKRVPLLRKPCHTAGDKQLKLVARRTGADRLFILPQGHAVHDAGSHAKAKGPETASSKPANPRAKPEGRRNRKSTRMRCQPSIWKRDQSPRPEAPQATHGKSRSKPGRHATKFERPGGRVRPRQPSRASAKGGGPSSSSAQEVQGPAAPQPKFSPGGASPSTQSQPRGRRGRGDVRGTVKHERGPTYSP
jgi:hypothetical protein